MNVKNKSGHGFYRFEIAVICTLIAILGLTIVLVVREHAIRYSPESYAAWCKLTGREDFSYQEWKNARRAGLLDSSEKSRAIPVFMPVPVR